MLPSVDLVRLRDGKTETLKLEKDFKDDEIRIAKVGGPRAKGFRVMIEKFQAKVMSFLPTAVLSYHFESSLQLPDMDFPINAKAEGRILVPWEHRMYPNMTQQNSSGVYIMSCSSTFHQHDPLQLASRPCLEASLFQIGAETAMFGKHTGGRAIPLPKLDDFSILFVVKRLSPPLKSPMACLDTRM